MKKNLKIEFELEEDYGNDHEDDESEKIPDYEIGDDFTLGKIGEIVHQIINTQNDLIRFGLIEMYLDRATQRLEIGFSTPINKRIFRKRLLKTLEAVRENFMNRGKTFYIYQNL